MKKFFRYIIYIILLLISLIVAGILFAIFAEDLAALWRKKTYSHIDEVAGISIGTDKSDLIFKHGSVEFDGERYYYKDFAAHFYVDEFGKIRNILFQPNQTNSGYDYGSFPIKSIDELLEIFGEPNIFYSRDSHLARTYTYSNDKLKTGTSYYFEQNKLIVIMIGDISWGKVTNADDDSGVGKYLVNGIQYCPGLDCPFDEKAEAKPEWSGKTIHDYILSAKIKK